MPVVIWGEWCAKTSYYYSKSTVCHSNARFAELSRSLTVCQAGTLIVLTGAAYATAPLSPGTSLSSPPARGSTRHISLYLVVQ